MNRRVNLGDVQLNVWDAGEGHPILFLHGFPLSHAMWRPQLDEFVKDYRVIAPDLRGFGGSSPPGGMVTMEQFADDVAQLLQALQITEPVTVCGLSMGGYIAWMLWERHPERVARMIQCDTRAAADSEATRQTRAETAKKVMAEGSGVVANSMPQKLFSRVTQQRAPQLVEETREVMLATPPASLVAALQGMAVRPDMTGRLAEIQVPTLVIGGSDDLVVPIDEMRKMAAAMPDATFIEIPHAGHMAPLEDPEQVNAAIRRFLTR